MTWQTSVKHCCGKTMGIYSIAIDNITEVCLSARFSSTSAVPCRGGYVPPSQHGQHRGLQLLFHIGSKGWQTTERLTLLTLQQKAGVCLSCHSSYDCSLPQRAGHFQTDALVLCTGTTRHTARNCWHGSTSWLIQGKFSSQKLQIYLEISVDQFT